MLPHKRKISEMLSSVPSTPSMAEALEEAIRNLNKDADIDLLFDDSIGPNGVSRRRVILAYTSAFYKNKPALDQVVSVFLGQLSTLSSKEAKYDRLFALLEPLQEGIQSQRTPDQRAAHSSTMTSLANLRRSTASPTRHGLYQFRPSKFGGSSFSKNDSDLQPQPTPSPSNNNSNQTSFTNTSNGSFTSTAFGDPTNTAQTSFESKVEALSRTEDATSSTSKVASPVKSIRTTRTLDWWLLPGHAADDKAMPLPGGSNANQADENQRPMEKNTMQTLIPPALEQSPFEFQLEVQRLLQIDSPSSKQVVDSLQSYNLASLYKAIEKEPELLFKPAFTLTSEGAPQLSGQTLKGELQWTGEVKPLFRLHVSDPVADGTSALQRQYGCDRILRLSLPPISTKPRAWPVGDALTRLRSWLSDPMWFLGRRWSIFVLLHNKDTKTSARASTAVGASKLILFAWNEQTTIVDALNWALPLRENGDQPSRKAYSRLELCVSATNPSFVCKSGDIAFGVKDQLGTDDPDDQRFLDPKATQAYPRPRSGERKVMNDGCCWMSYKLASEIRDKLDLKDIPKVIQARLAGSKGLWYILDDYFGACKDPQDGTLIGIAESQIKVKRATLDHCDSSILTLNIVKVNTPAKPAILYPAYIPILLDRGVPEKGLREIAEEQVAKMTNEYLEALRDPFTVDLRNWIRSQNEWYEDMRRDASIPLCNEFPISREERVITMLEQNFDPKKHLWLSEEVRAIGKRVFEAKKKQFKIKLPMATSLMGIADPRGVLQPGEIQVNFSAPFKDAVGMSWERLRNTEALVARNPALAPWDMQKVRLVQHPELLHLTDVVIFSIKGSQPLAEKLQGGDYDGDIFWICWKPSLVEGFLNHPAPWEPPPPESLGIKKDVRKVSDFIEDPSSEKHCCKWLGTMAAARLQFPQLGIVSELFERVTYAQGRIDSEQAISLIHLHDYLVDADKQGYNFDNEALAEFASRRGIDRGLPMPYFWKFTKAIGKEEADGLEPNNSNAVDSIYHTIVIPAINQTLKTADHIVGGARDKDEDLTRLYCTTIKSLQRSSQKRVELESLSRALAELHPLWNQVLENWSEKSGTARRPWNELIKPLRDKYLSIQPRASGHPDIKEWMRGQGHDLSLWEKFKASAFADLGPNPDRPYASISKMLFNVAGKELCILKAHETTPHLRLVSIEHYCGLKPRKFHRDKTDIGALDEQAGFETAEDDDDDDG